MKSILVAWLLLTGLVAQADITIDRLIYRGWVDSYRLTTGRTSVVVVPEIGGRVMEFSLDGRNVIWENREEFGKTYPITKEWHNYGGYKIWLAPQDLWGWPPDPMLDFAKANVELLRNNQGQPVLKLTSAPSLESKVVFEKEISFDESGELLVKQRMYNIGGTTIRYSIWGVTQVKTPCFVVFPLKAKSRFAGGINYIMTDSRRSRQFSSRTGLCITTYLGEVGKIGSDSDGPWMVWFKDDLAYVKIFEPMKENEDYPDGGCSVEVFTSEDKLGYVEMEILGPIVTLRPGEHAELSERWRIFQLTQPVTDENRVIKAIDGMRSKGWIP